MEHGYTAVTDFCYIGGVPKLYKNGGRIVCCAVYGDEPDCGIRAGGRETAFRQNKRKVTLSKEGEAFLYYAKRILELQSIGIQEVNSLKKYANTFRIGTTNTIYECYLFPVIRKYMAMHPENAVKITIGHSTDLLPGIAG